MLLEDNSIELNINAPPELTQQVIKEFKLWDKKILEKEYKKSIQKLSFILSDAVEEGVSIEKEPYLTKILQLIKQTQNVLVQHIFENMDIIKHLLAFSVLVMRDLYIFAIQGEAGALSPILVKNLKAYKGDMNE